MAIAMTVVQQLAYDYDWVADVLDDPDAIRNHIVWLCDHNPDGDSNIEHAIAALLILGGIANKYLVEGLGKPSVLEFIDEVLESEIGYCYVLDWLEDRELYFAARVSLAFPKIVVPRLRQSPCMDYISEVLKIARARRASV